MISSAADRRRGAEPPRAAGQARATPGGRRRGRWRCARCFCRRPERLGLAPAPRELAPGRRETDDEALIRAVIEIHVRPAPPDEAACRAFHSRRSRTFPRAEPLRGVPHPAARRARRRRRPRRRPRDRPRPSSPTSTATPAPSTGSPATIPPATRGPTAAASARSAPGTPCRNSRRRCDRSAKGAITPEPVETRYGLHVIRLDARAEGAVLPFQSVEPRIRDMLERSAWARGAKALVARLLETAQVRGVDFLPLSIPAHLRRLLRQSRRRLKLRRADQRGGERYLRRHEQRRAGRGYPLRACWKSCTGGLAAQRHFEAKDQ